MDNAFEKIGVIDYRKSKYANFFIIGSFILFILIGVVFIVLSGSIYRNNLMVPIRLFLLYSSSRNNSFDIYEVLFQRKTSYIN